jgi:hypothetical protein
MSGGVGVDAKDISSDKTVQFVSCEASPRKVSRPNSDGQIVVSMSHGGRREQHLNRTENSIQFILRQSGLWQTLRTP